MSFSFSFTGECSGLRCTAVSPLQPTGGELFVRPPAPARAPPHCPFFVFFFCTFCRCLFGDAVASLPDEFFDDDELMVGLGSAKSCKIA